jgi:hypothetical protein
MDRIKDLIKEYLINTIQTKKNMRKRIYQLEEQLKEARANERYAVEQKDKYKETNKKLRKQINELKEKRKEK